MSHTEPHRPIYARVLRRLGFVDSIRHVRGDIYERWWSRPFGQSLFAVRERSTRPASATATSSR